MALSAVLDSPRIFKGVELIQKKFLSKFGVSEKCSEWQIVGTGRKPVGWAGLGRNMGLPEPPPRTTMNVATTPMSMPPPPPLVFMEGSDGRPLSAPSSQRRSSPITTSNMLMRPSKTEGKGRPMTANPSDKSNGIRRLRPGKREGVGRPESRGMWRKKIVGIGGSGEEGGEGSEGGEIVEERNHNPQGV